MTKFRCLLLAVLFSLLISSFVPTLYHANLLTAGSALSPAAIPPSLSLVQLDPNVVTVDTESVVILAKVKGIDASIANVTCTLFDQAVLFTQLDDETWNVTMSLTGIDLESNSTLDFAITMTDTAGNGKTEVIRVTIGVPWDRDPPELEDPVIVPLDITRKTKIISVVVKAVDLSEIASASLEFCSRTVCHEKVPMTTRDNETWSITVDVTSVFPKIDVLYLNLTISDKYNNTETYTIGTYNLGSIVIPSFNIPVAIAALAFCTLTLGRKTRK